ncbi:MAG TPA: ribonuclease HI [Bdellovibrionales bacterium]|nr:ribonuclease HI [Bdellovibrionales bacterium]
MPIVVFADGASSGNPGPGGWGSIIATPEGIVEELGGGDPETTNNRMELMAAIRALERLHGVKTPIHLYTDSTYVIRGITQWVFGWRKRDWKTAGGLEVSNQDLWKKLMSAVAGKKVKWKYVRGHSGVPGNERVDEIAVAFSKGNRPRLYLGPLLKYDLPIYDLPEDVPLPEMQDRAKGPKPAAYGYLSLIGGIAVRHKTWASCEARVKGRSGAKFKKAMSEEDEAAILRSWGVRPSDVRSEKES